MKLFWKYEHSLNPVNLGRFIICNENNEVVYLIKIKNDRMSWEIYDANNNYLASVRRDFSLKHDFSIYEGDLLKEKVKMKISLKINFRFENLGWTLEGSNFVRSCFRNEIFTIKDKDENVISKIIDSFSKREIEIFDSNNALYTIVASIVLTACNFGSSD